jgi:hypothetical protein
VLDQILTSITAARTPGDRVRAHARLENAACAARLCAMTDMLAAAHAADGSAERDQWRLDSWAAVCAQIGAPHQVTSGVASGLLMDAVTLRGIIIHVIARADSLDTDVGESAGPTPTPQLPTDSEPELKPKAAAEPPPKPEAAAAPPDLTAQRRALVGEPPPLLPKPWSSYTLSEPGAALDADRGQCPAAPPP